MKNKLLRKIVVASVIVTALMPLTANATTGNSDWPEVFPTSDAVWVYEVKDSETASPPYKYFTYELKKDIVIIGGVTYNKLYSGSYCVGLTRVEGNKVFFIPRKYDEDTEEFKCEYLLYYFPDKVGEKVETPNAPLAKYSEDSRFRGERNGGALSIEYIDVENGFETVYASYYLPKTDYYPFAYDAWMKGVGGLFGFWQGRRHIGLYDILYTLKSFTYKGKQLYPIISGVEQTDSNKNINVVFANREIRINGELTTPPYRFTLTDSYGKTVKEAQITANICTISTNEMLPGIYIYRISGTDINQTGKLIVK